MFLSIIILNYIFSFSSLAILLFNNRIALTFIINIKLIKLYSLILAYS
jgi:hypothetical protein